MSYSKPIAPLSSKFLFNTSKNWISFSIILCFLFSSTAHLQAQAFRAANDAINAIDTKDALKFVPNQNQWPDNVKYRINAGGMNTLFMESNTLTWLFKDDTIAKQIHDSREEGTKITMDAHAYKMKFIGSGQPKLSGFNEQQSYHNYFLGADPKKWAQKVPVYEGVLYDDLYAGIQMKAYSQYGNFKYDFIIQPGTDPSIIQMKYEGVDKLSLKREKLYIKTSVENIVEQKPYAYQIIDSVFHQVVCNYKLANNIVTFDLPNGYDSSVPLIIDPVVVAATLSGCLTDNFGFTATFDNAGNIYAGGISFEPGYPTTTGAFQIENAGGRFDMAVTKYNPTGTEQIYATYIGGNRMDAPHSMIVDFNGQLCIYGTSSSPNYPTTANAVQRNLNGLDIPAEPVAGTEITDIVVTKLNSDGSALVGSTFLGGDNIDGLNFISPEGQRYDSNRGEIVLDPQGNIYIASFTNSTNFPTTNNAFQTTSGGSQDGVVCKLNSDLSTLFWSTYIGESQEDAAMGLRVIDNGKVLVVGTTTNSNFPVGPDGHQSSWPGGDNNLFVIQFSSDGQNIEKGTYFGSTDGTEYGYFMDVDEENNVHIYGQTTGTIPITPNTYFANANSKQFIAALTPDLDDIVYSTVIGKGPGLPSGGFDFIPVAFMVDKCNGIYISAFSAEVGLPTTADAIDIGDDYFYLAKFSPNAADLEFGTYYGQSFHVDGGTSRFDKAGIVYQGVCSCTPPNGNNPSIMKTLPDAYSRANSENCTIGVFKIDFEIETVTAAAFAAPSTSGCAPFTIDFTYTGSDAQTFFWDFGTSETSVEENPSYTFTEAGTYRVMQVANAPNTCNESDTFFIQIDVLDNQTTSKDTAFCAGPVNLFLDATTANANYLWHDGTTGATFTAVDPGIYWVNVDIGPCFRRDSFIVSNPAEINLELGNDQAHCDINSVMLNATNLNAFSYQWSSGEKNPIINVTKSGNYIVTITDAFGCRTIDQVEIIIGVTPDIQLGPDTTICEDQPLILDATIEAGNLVWQDSSAVSNFSVMNEGLFWVVGNDQGCIDADSLLVTYNPLPIVDFKIIDVDCNGNNNGSIEPISPLSITNLDFQWSTGSTDFDLNGLAPGNYDLTVTDINECTFEPTIPINEPAPINLTVDFMDIACYGDGNGFISASSTSGGTEPYLYSLNGGEFSSNSEFTDLDGGNYAIVLQDANDCTTSTEIDIFEPSQIFLDAGKDKVIELGDSVRIDGTLFPNFLQDFLWESSEYVSCASCLRPYAKPVNTAEYILTYRDALSECVHSDTMLIFVEKPRNVYIPNVFSPQGDGRNDKFYPFGDQSVEQVNYMKIFDRWGEFIYESSNFNINDPTAGWDGTFKGKNMQPAVFVYVISVLFKDDAVKVYKGDVTIVN